MDQTAASENDGKSRSRREEILAKLEKRSKAHLKGSSKASSQDCSDGKVITHLQDDTFTANFSQLRKKIQDLLDQCPTIQGPGKMKNHFTEISRELKAAQDLIDDMGPFLTPYKVRSARESLEALRESVQKSQEKYIPKPKFTFKSKMPQKENVSKDTTDGEVKNLTPTQPSETPKVVQVLTPECGFSDRQDANLEMSLEEAAQKDIQLARLKNCRVKIKGSPSTVHLSGLQNSRVLLGPVTTSVFVEDCRGCVVAAACQQLRVHATADCSFYLHTISNPIIEDSRNLDFSPYTWTYSGLEEHIHKSGLNWEVNHWSDVQDFDCPNPSRPSPNWRILPTEERLDLSESTLSDPVIN